VSCLTVFVSIKVRNIAYSHFKITINTYRNSELRDDDVVCMHTYMHVFIDFIK
jgi:hypothetical protein